MIQERARLLRWAFALSAALGFMVAACERPPLSVEAGHYGAVDGGDERSAWRLVQELSIGQEAGADPYLFGEVSSAWDTGDRIYVVDAQVPAVRAFDSRGNYMHDVGRAGQGPGEYGAPAAVVVTDDGRVAVADAANARINIYDSSGAALETWPLQSPKAALDLTTSYDGEFFTEAWSLERDGMGIQAIGPEGLRGEIRFPPVIPFRPPAVEAGKGLLMLLPYAPTYVWAFAPGGEIIAGVGDRYRLVIEYADGATKTVEHDADAVGVAAGEAEFRATLATHLLRRMVPDGRIDVADLPRHKPAFSALFPDRAHRVWVVRPAAGRPDSLCAGVDGAALPPVVQVTAGGATVDVGVKVALALPPEELDLLEGRCWADTFVFDIFDVRTGAFLATLAAPEPGFRAPLFADEHTVVAAVADERGTIRVKRYTLEAGDS